MRAPAPAQALRTALLAPPAWLSAVADPARVAAALTAVLSGPAAAGGSPGVVAPRVECCEMLDLRARGAGWKARYRVTLRTDTGTDTGTGTGDRVDVVLTGTATPPDAAARLGGSGSGEPVAHAPSTATGVPATDGWRIRLPALGLDLRAEVGDRRLPAAALLLDPAAARALLERGLRAHAPAPVACTPVAVRYVYGSRCTVVYRLDPPGGAPLGGPAGRARTEDGLTAVVAKAHAAGEGARVHDAMTALWASPLARGDVVRIAPPVGYLPDVGVLLQGALPGDRTLREVLAGVSAGADPAPAHALLRRVADGLVALHGCAATGAPPRTWADDLGRVRATVDRVAPTWPDAAAALAPLLDAVARRAEGLEPTPARPAHGAFRPSQVLVDGDRVGFLDLDGFCEAEPERDVGRFTKALAKALLPADAASPASHARARVLTRELTDTFLTRYAAGAPLSRDRVAVWAALDVVAGLAQTAATLRPGAPTLLRLLDDALLTVAEPAEPTHPTGSAEPAEPAEPAERTVGRRAARRALAGVDGAAR